MTAIPNYPTIAIQIEFVAGTWTTLPYVPQASGGRGRNYELAALQAGTMSITVDCSDGALDPTNTTSPYYPNVKLNKRARIVVTWAGVTKAIFTGNVERYPQRWEFNGQYQFTDMVIIDVPANLSQNMLESAYTEAVKALHPSVWYPLSDASGSGNSQLRGTDGTTAAERAGGLNPAKFVTTGAVDPLATLGSVTSTALGLEGASVANFTPTTQAYGNPPATLLMLPRGVVVPPSGPWTMVLTVTGKPPPAGGGYFSEFALYMQSDDGNQNVTLGYQSPTASFGFDDAHGASGGAGFDSALVDGLPHQWAVSLSADNTTMTFQLDDGAPVQRTLPAGQTYRFDRLTYATIGGWRYLFQAINAAPFNGSVSNFLIFPTVLFGAHALSAVYDDITTLSKALLAGYAGDTTRGRFNRVAKFAGVTGINSTADGNSMLQHAQIKGKTVLSALQDTAKYENGSLFVDGDGVLWFVNRQNRNNRASTATFDDVGSGYPYLGLTTDYDNTHTVNDVTVARNNGVIAHVTNQASIDAYGRRTKSTTTEIQDDYQTIDAANYILGTYAEPVRRISSIELNPGANPALWPMVTSLDLNQAVTVVRSPGMGHGFTQVCWVEQIKYNMDASTGSFTMSLQLSPANAHPVFRLDDPVFGRLDAGNQLTY